jgi:hypothetical protein
MRHPLASRVGSREADITPDRGAQGDALKTLLAMPFALDGNASRAFTFPPSPDPHDTVNGCARPAR